MSTRHYLAILILVLLAVAVRYGLAANESDRPPDSTAQLTDRIKALEARVEALERANVPQLSLANIYAGATDSRYSAQPVRPQQVPSNWTPREFNGMTYYLVPLGKSSHEESR